MPENRFKCPDCGKVFGEKVTLKEHVEMEHSNGSVTAAKKSIIENISGFEKYFNVSFGLGLILGIILTSAAFSGYMYWDSLDQRTTVPVTVVNCDTCDYNRFKDATDRMFKTSYREVDYRSEEGQELIQKYNLKYVPGFIFDREQLEKAENFTAVKPTLVESEDAYVIPDEGEKVAQRLSSGMYLNSSEAE
jgi:glutaredoxin